MGDTKVTYLLGAGASANKVPIVSTISEKLQEFLDTLKDPKYEFKDQMFGVPEMTGVFVEDYRKSFISEIENLIKECKSHLSIDTYARLLFLISDYQKLNTVKFIFNEFLLYEQFLNGVDKRYDGFFAAILSKDENNVLLLPDNINILSWNYDNQIELSYSKFFKSSDTNAISKDLQIFPLSNYNEFDPTKFCVMKLNGSAGGTIVENNVHPFRFDFEGIRNGQTNVPLGEVIKTIYYRYARLTQSSKFKTFAEKKQSYPTIFYSWDNNDVYDRLRDQTYKIINSTEILVIIGYSFPTFNRDIDRLILNSMRILDKIFLQTKKDNMADVLIRIKALLNRDIQIVPIEGTDEFYIPFEF
jgi:hypothetical protein